MTYVIKQENDRQIRIRTKRKEKLNSK